MSKIEVLNWEQNQTYRKDRGAPPWIKVYRNLMANCKWAVLTDAEKGQLVSLWIVAADGDGKLPSDPKILRKICQLDEEPNISKFIELGLLRLYECHNDNQMTPACQPNDAPETETETETERAPAKKISSLPDLEANTLNGHYQAWFEENCPQVSRFELREELVLYCRSKGKKYSDYWATMQTWARRRQKEIKPKSAKPQASEVMNGF